MRPVRDPAGMQGDHAFRHILAAHEIAVDIVKDLITVDIAVIVGGGYREGMIIEQPGAKGTDDEIVSFESLVDRRRLMDPPRYRLEIVNAERIRITATVPADDVERVMRIVNSVYPSLLPGSDQEITLLIMRSQ